MNYCIRLILQTLLTTTFIANGIVLPNENDLTIHGRSKRQLCSGTDFLCNSGQCINGIEECDGIAQCDDKSDETDKCRRLKCPQFSFTCKYGACVDLDLKCNGKTDCVDGSDESISACPKSSISGCSSDQFRCMSGQCIDALEKCDGIVHCTDKSDETSSTCWNIKCPEILYRCDYGACIDGNAGCNGIEDCADGSDEKPSKCTKNVTTVSTPVRIDLDSPSSIVSGSCRLPEHPENGEWQTVPLTNFKPGQYVKSGQGLKILCKDTYTLYKGFESILCDNGKWSHPIKPCLKSCPDIPSTDLLNATCFLNNIPAENNCLGAIDGTVAKYECASYYEIPSTNYIDICRNGSWGRNTPKCVPECGKKRVDPTLLIVNGSKVTKGDFPWQVALYSSKEQICGGTLIGLSLIISAAHCVTDSYGVLYPKENYEVGVGKYYINRNDQRDEEAQFSSLKKIIIPKRYQGFQQHYSGDIALLITTKRFNISHRVQPVCMDWSQIYENDLTNPQRAGDGYVTGWGFTKETGERSEVLKEIKLPLVNISKCTESILEDFYEYLTDDKLCAGFIGKGAGVCTGDSGGGLVFEKKGKYYLTGIVSLSPRADKSGGCDTQQVALFTNMYNYMTFYYYKWSKYENW